VTQSFAAAPLVGSNLITLDQTGYVTASATEINDTDQVVGSASNGNLNQLIQGLGSCDLRTIIDLNHENTIIVSGQDLSTLPAITQGIVTGKLN